jgi:hypothetical protein
MHKMLITAALLLATSAVAQPVAAPASMSAAEEAQLRDNLDRGVRLYEFDQAAWHTTDTLRADLSAAQLASVRGWVVTERLDGERVSYFGRDSDRPFLVYSADWDGKQVTARRVAQTHEDLSAQQRRLVAALEVARPASAKLPRCSNAPFNAVVLPGISDSDPISVYFLTPQTKTGSIPFGGHYRIDVKDGAIVGQRAFTKSCFEMTPPSRPSGAQPAAMAITHLLDAIPTEIHVFDVYNSGFPLYVMVRDGRIYAVELKGGQASVRLVNQNVRLVNQNR